MKCIIKMLFILVVSLCLILGLNEAKWSRQIKLNMSSNVNYFDLYTDPETGFHHLLATVLDRNATGTTYIRFDSFDHNMTYKFECPFKAPPDEFFIFGRIIGEGDSLYALLISASLSSKIYDLWFTEFSAKEDKCGQVLNKLPRTSGSENCKRYGNSLLFVKETGAIFIFFVEKCISKPARFGFVYRLKKDETFSNVAIIYTQNNTKDNIESPFINAQYTMNKTTTILHVIITSEVHDPLKYMSSSDHGKTWTNPRPLSENFWVDCLVPFSTTGNTDILPNSFLAFSSSASYSEEESTYLYHIGNNVTKDKASIKPPNRQVFFEKVNPMALCGTEKKPLLFTILIPTGYELEYSVWDVNSKFAQRLGHPFNKYKQEDENFVEARLSCSTTKNLVTATAIVHVSPFENNSTFFAAQDTQELYP